MKGRTRTKSEKEFQDQICSLGCIVCRKFLGVESPPSFHHMEGRVKEGAHYKGIPLCGKHHQIPDRQKPPRWFTFHDSKAEFEKAYGSQMDLYHECLELIGEQSRSIEDWGR